MTWIAETWINLVAAVGSLSAAGVALWLGLDAKSKERRDRRDRANLCAAAITAKLEHTMSVAQSGLATCVFTNLELSVEESRYQSSKRIRELMALGYFKPDIDTLLGLSILDNNCANRIARAFDILDVIKGQTENIPLGEFVPGAKANAYGYSEMLLEEWIVMFGSVDDLLRVALRECEKVSAIAAPHPTGEEIHGPRDED